MIKEIPLTQGKTALIDEADYPLISGRSWYAVRDRGTYYAKAGVRREDGRKSVVCMHRVLLGLTFGDHQQVDHKNGNGLDNRRENLRLATNAENQCNQGPRGKTSNYKGVASHQGKWWARITVDGKQKSLGLFTDEAAAASAYDNAARAIHGEFAYLNFPETKAVSK